MKKGTKALLIAVLVVIAAFMYRNEISDFISPLIHKNNAPKPEETNPKATYEYYYNDYKNDVSTPDVTWPAYN